MQVSTEQDLLQWTPISDEELEYKRIIDRLHTDNPTWGARQMSAQLKQRGYKVGRRKAVNT